MFYAVSGKYTDEIVWSELCCCIKNLNDLRQFFFFFDECLSKDNHTVFCKNGVNLKKIHPPSTSCFLMTFLFVSDLIKS